MSFLSPVYILALPVIALLYYHLPLPMKKPLLLLSSWAFYLYGSPNSFWILIAITIISFCTGLLLNSDKNSQKSKTVVILFSSAVILSFLVVFKYTGLGFVLPIGISFYTFQTLSYCLDVYKGNFKAERNFLDYALYVSFFPQLVAGPIERPARLLPAIKKSEQPSKEDISEGLTLIILGFFKKIVVADFASVYVNAVFANPSASDTLSVILGAVLFSLQIYSDFSGYSDIARGSARFFGVELMRNFDSPYLADNIRDFWRKWHISLTSWFTDYIYIPLGGNRKGAVRTAFNTLLVFVISGIWHGAGLKFILWGLGHGLLILFEDIPLVKKIRSHLPKPVKIVLNFCLVSFLWIFFATESTLDALRHISHLSRPGFGILSLTQVFLNGELSAAKGIITTVLLAISLYVLPRTLQSSKVLKNGRFIAFILLFLMTLTAVFTRMSQLSAGITNAFIYFRF